MSKIMGNVHWGKMFSNPLRKKMTKPAYSWNFLDFRRRFYCKFNIQNRIEFSVKSVRFSFYMCLKILSFMKSISISLNFSESFSVFLEHESEKKFDY